MVHLISMTAKTIVPKDGFKIIKRFCIILDDTHILACAFASIGAYSEFVDVYPCA